MSSGRGLQFGARNSIEPRSDFAHNLAYVIGINDYSNGIPPLRTAVADAEKLGHLLRSSHDYKVRLFPRDATPSAANLRKLLNSTIPQDVGSNDRVIFYFAGHGIALDGDDGPEGYLVPEDASRDDKSSFLPMTEINEALAALPCRHLLLILDCCFAGAFRWSSTRDISPLPDVIHKERFERYVRDPAWQVLTSAAHDQKAIDLLLGKTFGERIETTEHSPFAAALFKALEGDADLIPRGEDGKPGGDGVITATELYMYLRQSVEIATEQHASRQTPGLWPLKKHDKGEYILLTPGHELNLPPAPELNYDNNPYRGLRSFDEEQNNLFFGRNDVIKDLHKLVSANPLTIVLGASGTGKSSVVKAGLVPDLRTGDDERWEILPVFRPGKSPLTMLASLSIPGDGHRTNEAVQLAQLWSDHNTLAKKIKAWSNTRQTKKRLLLIIDQFEELITLCWNKSEREQFVKLLANALQALPNRFRLVVTLRSDFEAQFSECALKNIWKTSRYIVPPMSTDDLREAIEGPASVRVLYFQPPELVDRLIDEVIQTPGAMPLLSFTLSELYVLYLERRGDDRCLTFEDFDEFGGVAGSLRSRAKDLYDKLDSLHQPTMQRIMLRMVSTQGGELARRRVPKSELVYPTDEENTRVLHVLRQLSEARLVVEGKEVDGEPYVEPAHDALVRGWDKLLAWTRSEQEQLSLRRLLTPAANDWHSHDGGTWHANPRLSLLNRIRRSGNSWLNQTETQFIARSLTKRRTILASATAFILVAFIALSGVTYYALGQRNQAVQRERESIAETARLFKTKGEQAQLNGHLQSAMHFYAKSLERRKEIDEQGPDCRMRIGVLAGKTPILRAVIKCGGRPEHVLLSPQGDRLLTSSKKTLFGPPRSFNLWDSSTGQFLTTFTKKNQESPGVEEAVFSPDGRFILVHPSGQNFVELWDSRNGNFLRTFSGHTDDVTDMCFGTSLTILTGSNDGTVRVWDVESGQELQKLDANGAEVRSVRYSPDEELIAASLHRRN